MSFLLSSEEFPGKRPPAYLPRLDSYSPQEMCRDDYNSEAYNSEARKEAGPKCRSSPGAAPNRKQIKQKWLFLQSVNQHNSRNSHDLISNGVACILIVCIACWEIMPKAVHSNLTSFFQSTDLLQPITTHKGRPGFSRLLCFLSSFCSGLKGESFTDLSPFHSNRKSPSSGPSFKWPQLLVVSSMPQLPPLKND